MENINKNFGRHETDDQELYPNQYADNYPVAADSTGDGDPDWQKQYGHKIDQQKYNATPQSDEEGDKNRGSYWNGQSDSIH